jgi:CHAT domain-containing protein
MRIAMVILCHLLFLCSAARSEPSPDESLARGAEAFAAGRYSHAIDALEAGLRAASDDRSRMRLLGALGGVEVFIPRRSAMAELHLQEALALARSLGDEMAQGAVMNDLGNLHAASGRFEEAIGCYSESAEIAQRTGARSLEARARINLLSATVRAGVSSTDPAPDAARAVAALDDSEEKALLLVTLGDNAPNTAENAYRQALEIGQRISSDRALCWAWGSTGRLEESKNNLEAARIATRRALFLAQRLQSPDALYLWEWQLARIHREAGRTADAIAAYGRSIAAVTTIRTDIALYGPRAWGKGFRQAVAPVFYEQADLLLRQERLEEAREVIENLKGAELEDYFQDECVDLLRAKETRIDKALSREAVVYVIPLADRTELLVSLPQGAGLKRMPPVSVNAKQLEATARQFRRQIEDTLGFEFKESAAKLYDWLVRPLEGVLEQYQVDTLVFVPDGDLRAIPMGALFDGSKFLVEKYAVAISPGLSLMEPRPLPRDPRILAAGLSTASGNFPPLPFVPEELARIQQLYDTKVLEDAGFSEADFGKEFKGRPFAIVHIASHGQFGRNANETYILTADGRLELSELERLIQPSQFRGQPVEMLALSACETARGEDGARAALGLAGIAIKAGARSTLGTLWCVDDESSSLLIGAFYQSLHDKPELSKAKALQAAQLELIRQNRYKHPGYWAPYQVFGNWL